MIQLFGIPLALQQVLVGAFVERADYSKDFLIFKTNELTVL